jgi:hypothetical protein
MLLANCCMLGVGWDRAGRGSRVVVKVPTERLCLPPSLPLCLHSCNSELIEYVCRRVASRVALCGTSECWKALKYVH